MLALWFFRRSSLLGDVFAPGGASTRPQSFGYLGAVLASVAAVGLRALVGPIMGHSAPVSLSLIPVVLAAWYGGLGPALVATVLTAGSLISLTVGSVPPLDMSDPSGIARLGGFVVVSLLVSALAHRLHGAVYAVSVRASEALKLARDLEEQKAELEQQVEESEFLAQEAEDARLRAEQAQANAEHTERRMREVFMRAPALIATLRGPDHVFESANAQYLTSVGRADIVGKPLAEALPEVAAQGFIELLDHVYQRGVPYVSNETRVVLNRGAESGPEEVFFNFVYQPLSEHDGSVSGILVHAVDVTEQVRARESAEEANSVKSAFLATMSHELRTPLNAIIGYTDLMLLGVPEQVPASAHSHLNRVQSSARHLLDMIDELLTFSKLQAGQMQVNAEPIDLVELVCETAALVEPLAKAKGLNFRCDTAMQNLIIETDASKVRQIILNLLSNAVKFTEHGSVRVEAKQSLTDIVLEVCDTGPGIKAEQLEQVFEPFVQLENGVRRPGGTGLGLSVTRDLARLLGGEVNVRSTPGAGSTFIVRMPLTCPATCRAA